MVDRSFLEGGLILFQKVASIKRFLVVSFLLFWIGFSVSCATSPDGTTASPDIPEAEEVWGIRPVSLRITGAGHFLDFRYRVVDSEKASRIMQKGQNVYLIHQPSETVMPVPVTKLGPLRGTAVQPKEDRQYAILFNNTGKAAKSGDKVTMVIGDMRIENMTVDSVIKP